MFRAHVSGAAADGLLLDQLRTMGSDLDKSTDVRFYLYIPGKKNAKRAATTLSRDGFHVLVDEPLGKLSDGSERAWRSIVSGVSQPRDETARRIRLSAKLQRNA
jgi:Regulator of ribonuclease activity B